MENEASGIHPHSPDDMTSPMPYLYLATGHPYVLQTHGSITIGSDRTCDLPITGQAVAPRHLIVQPRGHAWQVATLDLNAPVTINGRPVRGLAILHDGDHIQIGDVTIVWHEQPPKEDRGPWMGLALIFLTVLTLISVIFAAFRLESQYGQAIKSTTITAPAAQTTTPNLTPATFSPQGHPVYHITLPNP